MFERALGDCKRILGADHRQTESVHQNLNYAREVAERLTDSDDQSKRVSSQAERVLGADHPETVWSRQLLGYANQSASRGRARGAGADASEPKTTSREAESRSGLVANDPAVPAATTARTGRLSDVASIAMSLFCAQDPTADA